MGRTTTIRFKEIGFKRTVKAKTKSGKIRTVTAYFFQTQNPWNDKSADQILEEERKKAARWEIKTKKEIEAMP